MNGLHRNRACDARRKVVNCSFRIRMQEFYSEDEIDFEEGEIYYCGKIQLARRLCAINTSHPG